ncbi:MAG TPA: hypothetical protein VNZ53_14485 [Steroidobacteraceae bacterium]|jgi:hypothetical protein|nr:hypothetical protein [Steroidobacteraceae bacterium]
MSEDLESQLRAALTPVAPRAEFTQRLIARVTADKGTEPNARGIRRRSPRATAWWLSASMAASLLIAVGVQHYRQERREAERGLEARREVIEALRMTSQKLNLAYEVIKDQSSLPAEDKPGV